MSNKPFSLVGAAIDGNIDVVIAAETTRRLEKEMKDKGTDTFTISDIRRIRNGIFGITDQLSDP